MGNSVLGDFMCWDKCGTDNVALSWKGVFFICGFVQNLGESERVLFIDHEFFVEDGRECKITRV